MSDSQFSSSPPRAAHGKERRNPSITPRKFKRFFTPRSRVPSRVSSARKALQDLGAPDLNRKHNPYQTPAPSSPLGHLSSFIEETVEEEDEDDFNDQLDAQLPKRRKLHHTPDSSPCRPNLTTNPSRFSLPSSPSTRSRLLSPMRSLYSSQTNLESESDESEDETLPSSAEIKRLAPLASRGFVGQFAQRELGGMSRAGLSSLKLPTADWRMEAADFRTTSDDIHECNSHDSPGSRCIPFCVTSCHKESLVAVGDEEGRVRLLDTSRNEPDLFRKIHISFQAHTNAIIDLDFSADDLRLATASGDQTGRVIDIMTQAPIANLQHHTASLKQVRFQPGAANSNVLATSSRDGSVQIWDLRCTGRPVQNIPTPEDRQVNLAFRRPQLKEGKAVNSLYHAHARTSRQVQQAHGTGHSDTPSRRELPSRAGDVSVTCLQFLPEGKEHLLLTACEADACINLWDIRSIHTSRQKVASALSTTAPPPSHQHWRPFGISSLALSTDGARLYSTCKDNTVYAYSMSHLILGNATELSARNGYPRRRNAATHQGLGPLYGFRHPSFHATSFYVKCDVRQARDGRSEILAVGSSDSCAVLFPTAERYFRDDLNGGMGNLSLDNSTIAISRPDSSSNAISGRSSGGLSLSNRPKDDIPIVRLGAPLVRAHESEVGALSWTNEGKLVTVGDDYMVRLWSEDREEAKGLRTGGEFGGKRWGCGWAEVGDDWDEDVEEED